MQNVPQPQQPSWQAPGAEFLAARLRRAAALSPNQRGPDEAAFLMSVQLCREVCELLPLAPSDGPALPSQQLTNVQAAMELALVKFWQALHICPYCCTPASDTNYWQAFT